MAMDAFGPDQPGNEKNGDRVDGMSRDDYWHVVQLKPAGLERARENLLRQGFELFCPLERAARPARRGRPRKSTVRPLFPGYGFVGFDDASMAWHRINSTYGVSRLLTGPDQRPKAVPSEAMAALFARTDSDGFLRPPDTLRPGESVRIVSGAFSEWVGRVEAALPQERYLLLFEMMGRHVKTSVSRQDLQRA